MRSGSAATFYSKLLLKPTLLFLTSFPEEGTHLLPVLFLVGVFVGLDPAQLGSTAVGLWTGLDLDWTAVVNCTCFFDVRPNEFKELIDAVFRFDWRANDKVVQSFSGLLSHLVSANSTCMVPAMHMLVRNLVLSPLDLDGESKQRKTSFRFSWLLLQLVAAALFSIVGSAERTRDSGEIPLFRSTICTLVLYFWNPPPAKETGSLQALSVPYSCTRFRGCTLFLSTTLLSDGS